MAKAGWVPGRLSKLLNIILNNEDSRWTPKVDEVHKGQGRFRGAQRPSPPQPTNVAGFNTPRVGQFKKSSKSDSMPTGFYGQSMVALKN